MTAIPTPADCECLAALHLQGALAFHAVLTGMVNGGAKLAEQIAGQACGPDAAPAVTSAKPFAEVTRSVRQSIMLAQKITAPPKDNSAARRMSARKQIIRRVGDAIYREAPERAETLHEELMERMETLECEEELEQLRPVAEIIRDIQADLGVCGAESEALWPRRTPADIAELCAVAAAPARPWPDTPPIRGP